MDNDPNTTQNMAFVEGYIQENAHTAPQTPIGSMSYTSTCSSCSGSNQMVISTDPSVIMTLGHNSSYTIYIKARVTGMRMFPLGALTPYEVTKTITVNANNLLITQAPDYLIQWDPATMTSVNLGCTTTDAQTGTQQVQYTISGLGGYTERNFNGPITRPGQHSFIWDGRDSLGFIMPKGIYSTKVNAIANIPTVSGDCNRSSYLSIQDAYVSSYGSTDAYASLRFSYKLIDSHNKNATDGLLGIYDPDWCLIDTWQLSSLEASLPGSTNTLDVSIPKPIKKGAYKIIASCLDGDQDFYKDHQNRVAMEAFTTWYPVYADNYDSSNLIGSASIAAQLERLAIYGEGYIASSFSDSSAIDARFRTEARSSVVWITGHGFVPAGGQGGGSIAIGVNTWIAHNSPDTSTCPNVCDMDLHGVKL